VAAFDLRTRKQLWQRDGARAWASAPEKNVVAVLRSDGAGALGLDADTGEQVWSRRSLASLGDRVDTAAGVVVLADTAFQALHVVDVATGKDLWTKPAGDVVVTGPHGIVLTGQNARETAYDFATGARIGPGASLPQESDQVTVPMQFDADDREILARGCPGRG
jgi:outer membrane protein assembly factor BamB